MDGRKKVLATAWHPGSAQSIAPVVKKLQEEDRVDVVVVLHEFARDVFSRANISFKTIGDYGPNKVSLQTTKSILGAETPDLVLTGTSDSDEKNKVTIEQCFIAGTGFFTGMVSLAVMDWWSGFKRRFFSPDLGLCFLPKRVAVLDEIAQRNAVSSDIPSRAVVVTGNPYFDNLAQKTVKFSGKRGEEIRRTIGLNRRDLFFYAGNIFEEEASRYGHDYWDLDIITLMVGATEEVRREGRLGIVVKLHPRAPAGDKTKIKRALSGEFGVRLVEGIETHDLVLASDCTFVVFSTVAIEVVNLGRPCLSLQPGASREEDVLIPSKEGIIPVGYSVEDCCSLVQRAVESGYRQSLLEKASGFRTDGQATQRVVDNIYKMLDI